ncbi:FAD:protein FMN transferase [Streptomyces sp. SL13]|uniref:FAD:protein FMN transferase n=1 Tax=Streptantibioticus silvisoli TaxID=2705255 RepID=A0AA90HA83_9ACTN|nr:FAD:protein FMN transferase [Streptantibioticus silvisoli]MDI5974095.1 FAD:protein FMN transferase [Streptantibioticus silvisoli]
MRSAVEHIMGTVFSLAVPRGTDAEVFRAAADAAFAHLRHVDAVFSPFRPDSAVSLIADGVLTCDDFDDHPHGGELHEVLGLCRRLKHDSGGAFDAWAVGNPPGFDPCGAVKGWAAERAGTLLVRHGLDRYVLNAGGDVRVHGGVPGDPWRVALADPHRPGAVLAVLHVAEGAVATSGVSERGAHIFDPVSGRRAAAWDQVTVTGPDLALADGWATAALAMAGGPRGPAGTRGWLQRLAADHGYQAMAVDPDGQVWTTDGMRELLHEPAALVTTGRKG